HLPEVLPGQRPPASRRRRLGPRARHRASRGARARRTGRGRERAGQGKRFYDSSTAADVARAARSGCQRAGGGGRLTSVTETTQARILIVEDDPSIQLGLRMNLERAGYRVEVASDGELGLDRLRQEAWDLCILDLMLPKLNGFA